MNPDIKLRSTAEISAQIFVLQNKVKLLESDLRFRDEQTAADNLKCHYHWTSHDKLQRILSAFDPVREHKLHYPNNQTFLDVCIYPEVSLDLYRAPFVMLLMCEGAKTPSFRVAFDSSKTGDWSEVTELYLNLLNGCNLFVLTGQELELNPGKAKLAEVRNISVGGVGVDASVRVWAICDSENLIASPKAIFNQASPELLGGLRVTGSTRLPLASRLLAQLVRSFRRMKK